jgi:hypothetical protein
MRQPQPRRILDITHARASATGVVLLAVRDRRFRAMASTLLSRRGYSVATGHPDQDIPGLATREHADVVVIDATASLAVAAMHAARLSALVPPVGIVAVSSDPQDRLTGLPVIAKWVSFDALLKAIERARDGVRKDGVPSGLR